MVDLVNRIGSKQLEHCDIDKIAASVKKNGAIRYVAWDIGCKQSTLSNWLSVGNEYLENGIEDTPEAKLVIAFNRARLESMQERLDKIKANDAWQAQAWVLEKLHREEFNNDNTKLIELERKVDDLANIVSKKSEEFTGELPKYSEDA